MKIENNIGWCDATTNAVTGCDKVSPGCKNCYAESGTRARVLRAQGKETWGANGIRVPVNFEPVFRRLKKLCVCDKCHEANRWLDEDGRFESYQCVGCGQFNTLRRIRLFADSNSDWLDPKWPVETLARFLDAIRRAPNVDTQLLTKRIELWPDRIEAVLKWCEANDCKWPDGISNLPLRNFLADWFVLKKPPANLWLGVSVENQAMADKRIPLLLQTPAAIRFLSVEPLLEEVDLKFGMRNAECGISESELRTPHSTTPHLISWVIVGGESGKNRRDCGVNAIEAVAEQCIHAGGPVYVKQDCAFKDGQQGRIPEEFWKLKQFPMMNNETMKP